MKTKYPRSFYRGEPILALNWKQPYGSLMLYGKIETRTWPTKFRGYVLICTSKKPYDNFDILKISGNKQFGRIEETFNHYGPLGSVIAIGKLVDCRPMVLADEPRTFVEYKEPWEVVNKKGEIVVKRLWCHVYEDVVEINPIDFSAGQGWSFVSPEILAQLPA